MFMKTTANAGRVLWAMVIATFMALSTDAQIALVGIEYWFNSAIENKVYVGFDQTLELDSILAISTVGLPSGLHSLHIRMIDSEGQYSSVVSRLFMNTPAQSSVTERQITVVRYWWNDAMDGAQVIDLVAGQSLEAQLQPILEGFTGGAAIVHLQIGDNTGLWSVAQSRIVFITPTSGTAPDRQLVAWQYWLDDEHDDAVTIEGFTPAGALNISEPIDLSALESGPYEIYLRFKDNSGLWSSPVGAGFLKEYTPSASFQLSSSAVCVGEEIQVNSTSIDADAHLWDFGDGTTAEGEEAVHTYTTEGSYILTLTIYNNALDMEWTATQTVLVGALPDASISADQVLPACPGQVTLSIEPANAAYAWSTGQGTASISVTEAGLYSCDVSSAFNPACGVTTVVLDVDFVEINTGVSQNEHILTAELANAMYQWLDCGLGFAPIEGANGQVFEAESNGSYAVELQVAGCTVQSECFEVTTLWMGDLASAQGIEVFPNPFADYITVELSEFQGALEFRLIDGAGKTVWIDHRDRGIQFTFSMPALCAGVYYLEITDGTSVFHQRLMRLP